MNHDVYGIHLTMRIAAIANQEALNDEQAVSKFLVELVNALEMRVLAGPLTGREEGPPDHSGCSGVVILYESHAAIHTYPLLGEAFIDVFSCKPFDVAIAERVIARHFGNYTIIERATADRGIHWSRDVAREMQSWQQQR
jgi:S-adenosylmethionine decarboxylase